MFSILDPIVGQRESPYGNDMHGLGIFPGLKEITHHGLAAPPNAKSRASQVDHHQRAGELGSLPSASKRAPRYSCTSNLCLQARAFKTSPVHLPQIVKISAGCILYSGSSGTSLCHAKVQPDERRSLVHCSSDGFSLSLSFELVAWGSCLCFVCLHLIRIRLPRVRRVETERVRQLKNANRIVKHARTAVHNRHIPCWQLNDELMARKKQ